MEDTHPVISMLVGLGFAFAMPGFVALAFLVVSMFLVNIISLAIVFIGPQIRKGSRRVFLYSYLFSLAGSVLFPLVVFILGTLLLILAGLFFSTLFWDSDKSSGYGLIGGWIILLGVVIAYFTGVAGGAITGYKLISSKGVQSTAYTLRVPAAHDARRSAK